MPLITIIVYTQVTVKVCGYLVVYFLIMKIKIRIFSINDNFIICSELAWYFPDRRAQIAFLPRILFDIHCIC